MAARRSQIKGLLGICTFALKRPFVSSIVVSSYLPLGTQGTEREHVTTTLATAVRRSVTSVCVGGTGPALTSAHSSTTLWGPRTPRASTRHVHHRGGQHNTHSAKQSKAERATLQLATTGSMSGYDELVGIVPLPHKHPQNYEARTSHTTHTCTARAAHIISWPRGGRRYSSPSLACRRCDARRPTRPARPPFSAVPAALINTMAVPTCPRDADDAQCAAPTYHTPHSRKERLPKLALAVPLPLRAGQAP